MHSKQWHYSLHRDFQNCYSTRKKSFRILQLQFYKGTHPSTYNLHVHSTSREFSIQNPILHTEDKELFEYYYITEGKETFIPESRKEILRIEGKEIFYKYIRVSYKDIPGIPAARPSKGTTDTTDIPVFPDIPDIPVIHDLPAFPGNSTSSSISRESTPFQHSPIRMHILQFDWFPQKLHRVPVEQLQTFYKHSFFKEREML